MKFLKFLIVFCFGVLVACNEDSETLPDFEQTVMSMDNKIFNPGDTLSTVNINPQIRVGFPVSIDTTTIFSGIHIVNTASGSISDFTYSYENGLLDLYLQLKFGETFKIEIDENLKSEKGASFTPIQWRIVCGSGNLFLNTLLVDSKSLLSGPRAENISLNPTIQLSFSEQVSEDIFQYLRVYSTQKNYGFDIALSDDNQSVNILLKSSLSPLLKHTISILDGYEFNGLKLSSTQANFYTNVDPSFKFPEISDEELLTKVQEQTFKYFYDFAAPVSGLAKERNSSPNTVTSGGSGFGIMALVVGMERGFITRDQGLSRIEKILNYLETADRFHGAYSHWLEDSSGKAVAFSTKDNGGDLVETSFLFQGLITFRQYLNAGDQRELEIIDRINTLWNAVEWDWYTQGGQNVLTWHWSPNYGFEINFQLRGYYEAMITYVLAASSTTHTISKEVYHQGWMRSGGVVNGKDFYGIKLPIGYDYGGPLFFAHYSFLGLDPRNLQDAYANYWEQNVAHTLINYEYCIDNPKNYLGYSNLVWGLTASDNPFGYSAQEPNNDNGTITPTAALSSFPYTPEKSLETLKYFYYILGDRLWGEYGFYDAFNITEGWWANSTLAIDQGPIVIMIENHRTGLLWNLFMSAPEVKTGLSKLEITYE